MPILPAHLGLPRLARTPEPDFPAAQFLTHDPTLRQSVPIPYIDASTSTSTGLSTSELPPLTSTSMSTSTTPYSIQTPMATAGPSRVAIIDTTSPTPMSASFVGNTTLLSLPKSFPHNADLLGAPSETSSRNSSPSSRISSPSPQTSTTGGMEIEADLTPEVSAEPTQSSFSSTLAVQERLARVRERLAARRAERAVEDAAHRRSHSRHIFDPESPSQAGMDDTMTTSIRPLAYPRASRGDAMGRALGRSQGMSIGGGSTIRPLPLPRDYVPTLSAQALADRQAATATAAASSANTLRRVSAGSSYAERRHASFAESDSSIPAPAPAPAAEPPQAIMNAWGHFPQPDPVSEAVPVDMGMGMVPWLVTPSSILPVTDGDGRVPAPRPPTSFGWETTDRPSRLLEPTGYQQPAPMAESTLRARHQFAAALERRVQLGTWREGRSQTVMDRLARLDEVRDASRPQEVSAGAESDGSARSPWWLGQNQSQSQDQQAEDNLTEPTTSYSRNRLLDEDQPPIATPPTPNRPAHQRWRSAGNSSTTSSDAPISGNRAEVSPLIDMWNRSVQQTVDRRLPLDPQRDWRMAQHLGEGLQRSRLDALSSRIRRREEGEEEEARPVGGWAGSGSNTIRPRSRPGPGPGPSEGQGLGSMRRRLAAIAGPGENAATAAEGLTWGEVPIDTANQQYHGSPIFRRLPLPSASTSTAIWERETETVVPGGFYSSTARSHPINAEPVNSARPAPTPSHPYLRHRLASASTSAPAAAAQRDELGRPWYEPDMMGLSSYRSVGLGVNGFDNWMDIDGGIGDIDGDGNSDLGDIPPIPYAQPTISSGIFGADYNLGIGLGNAARLAQAHARYPFPPIPIDRYGAPSPPLTFAENMAMFPHGSASHAYGHDQLYRHYHPHPHPHHQPGCISTLEFKEGMTREEKMRVVKIVLRSVQRLEVSSRKKAAESVVKSLPWGQWNGEEVKGVEREVFCSVCHDDYEDESKVAITPCHHMYHNDCLEPNISSCPMCRRDLAVLAIIKRIMPASSQDDAVPLWMSA